MENLLMEILQTVATVLISACAAFLIQFLQYKSKQIETQINSEEGKALLAEVTDAVTTAVAYTSQTYVDALKKAGLFDKDAQEKALQRSLEKTVSLLSDCTRNILGEMYGDLDEFLISKIETEVRRQKNEAAALPLVGELISTVETTVEETED